MTMTAFKLNSTVQNILHYSSIYSDDLLKNAYCTPKNLVKKFTHDEELTIDEMFNVKIIFAVTVRNENRRIRNPRIIPCLIINTESTNTINRYVAYPLTPEQASKLYHVNFNSKSVDDEFDTRYGTCSFWCTVDAQEFHFDPIESSVSNVKFFSKFDEAKQYLNSYKDWFKTKKIEDENRKKLGRFTVSEIAEKLGIDVSQLVIVDDNDNEYEYFDGACPEKFGEID